jgi:hypothetical protein
MKVVVAGAEHSGTRWVWALLSCHPEIEPIHISIPSEGKLKPLEGDVIVYVVRDRSCTLKSQEFENSVKQEHLEEMLSGDAVEMADRWFMKQGIKSDAKTVLISYETLLRFRDLYLFQIFKQIGVNEYITIPREGVVDIGYGKMNLKPSDQNKKYIK